MKVTFGVFFSLACLAVTLGLPASPLKAINEDTIDFVPLEKHNPFGDQPIIDTGVMGYDGPFSNPFSGFLENLEGIMSRIRQQMETLLKRLPAPQGNSTEEIPDFPISGGFPPSFGFGDIDLGKGNTTSVTKVIDGHKVVINETEYKKEDDFGGAFFKVRIIDVKPDSSELTTITTNKAAEEITTESTTRDRESLENSVENEIVKSREATNFDNIETFDEVDSVQPFQKFSTAMRDIEWNDVSPIQPFEDNSINAFDYRQTNRVPTVVDLSGDIRVNQIMADAGAPIDPDAEFIYDVREPYVKQFGKFINPR